VNAIVLARDKYPVPSGSRQEVMLMQQQPQSGWSGLIERWDGFLERCWQAVDPFVDGPKRPWVIAVLAVGVVVLGGLVGAGAWWMYDHHTWTLIPPLFKVAKLLGIGFVIVAALLFGSKAAKSGLPEDPRSGGAAGAKE